MPTCAVESNFSVNPWDVSNASVFLSYCCPECDFKSGELLGFSQHAVINHVLSNTLFGQTDLDHIDESSAIENNSLDEKYDVNEDFDGNFECVDENPEIVKNYVTVPPKSINNLSKTAQDIFKKSLKISNEEPTVSVNPKIVDKYDTEGVSLNGIKIIKIEDLSKLAQDIFKVSIDISKGKLPFCSICNISFGNSDKLLQHIAKVHEEKKSSDLIDILVEQEKTKETETNIESKKPLDCPECERSFSNGQNQRDHMYSVHKPLENIFNCSFCESKFKFDFQCNHHMRTKHSFQKGTFICETCGFTSNTSLSMEKHKMMHIKCSFCESEFAREDQLECHIEAKHPGTADLKYFCSECGDGFMFERNMVKHNEKHKKMKELLFLHERIKKHKCSICSKDFSTKTQLKGHIEQSHSRQTCENCGKSLLNKFFLKKHLFFDHGIKDGAFICEACPKTVFFTESFYKKHMKEKHENS